MKKSSSCAHLLFWMNKRRGACWIHSFEIGVGWRAEAVIQEKLEGRGLCGLVPDVAFPCLVGDLVPKHMCRMPLLYVVLKSGSFQIKGWSCYWVHSAIPQYAVTFSQCAVMDYRSHQGSRGLALIFLLRLHSDKVTSHPWSRLPILQVIRNL